MQIYTWTRVDLPPWKTHEISHCGFQADILLLSVLLMAAQCNQEAPDLSTSQI